MKYLATFFLLLCVSTMASAQLLIEDFNYTDGTLLTANGWTAGSGGGTNAITVHTTSALTYTGYAGSGIGNGVSLTTSGEDDYIKFTQVTSGTIYVSALVNLSAAQSTGDYFLIPYATASTGGGYFGRVFAKSSGSGFVFGLSKNTTTPTYETTVRDFNTTYLIVVKYTFTGTNASGTTDDLVDLWVNPSIGSTEPTATIPGVGSGQQDCYATTGINAVALRQGTAANAPTGMVDGIRVGTTWATSVGGVLLPQIALSQTSVDFGPVNVGTSLIDSITIQNNSAFGTLTISSISSSKSVFTVTSNATISPLSSQKIGLTYSPTAIASDSALIILTSNDPTSPDTIWVKGSGVQAGFLANKKTSNFGNVFKDSTKTDTITISNASTTASLVIDSVMVRSSNTYFTVSPTSGTVGTSSSLAFVISFKPTAKGAATAKIVFYHNAPSHQDTVSVSGNGILKEPLFSVTPTALDFHGVLVGQSKIDSLTIKNIGYDSLKISIVTTSDGVFTVTPTPAPLDTGKSQKFYITFTPTAVGIKVASIVFSSNVSEVKDTVQASGSGLAIVTIAEARKDANSDLIPDYKVTGDTLVITGIVTTQNMGLSAAQTSYFIQDNTGGIDVFQYGLTSTTYQRGDSVMVIGIVWQYNGLTEFEPLVWDDAHFKVLGHSTVPAPKHLTLHQFVTNAESYEGQLIEIDSLDKAKGTWPASPSNVSVYVTNASKADTAQMFLDLDSGIGGTEPVYPINLVGIVSQYTTATPPNNGYEISPRDSADISKTYIRPFIVVDGLKDDFYTSLTGPADGYLQIKDYAANDNGTPRNNADLSAKVWAAWDTTWFYLYTEVMDDTVCGNAPNTYQEDGMELKFDPQPKDSVANSIWAVGITALGKGSPGVVNADSLGNVPDSLKQWARRIIPGGYALEIAIKWSAIGTTEKVSVAKDSVFGLAVCFHDNDSSKTRVASIEWAAVMLDAVWNTPKYLGTVKFLADNKLQFIPKNNMTPWRTNPIPYDGTPFYINVDGTKDYIYNNLTGPQDGYLQIRSYAWNDNGKPTNDADLSSKVWTAWDTTWFYLYAEVKDDTVCGNAPQVYQEDGMELKFDPQPKDSVANSIWAVGLTALGKGSPGVVTADSLSGVTDSTGKKWARRIISGGYALELAMKWSAIGTTEKVSVAKDSVFGMAINFHDNDSSKTRVASIEWAAVMLDAVWNTPKYLGTVKFLADNKMQFIPTNNMTPWRTNPIPYDGSNYIRTGVNETQSTLPKTFSLAQNYPNPFNPSTTIEYSLPLSSTVTIKIYSILGQEVATLINSEQAAGYYKTVWNASRLASGMYFLRVTAQSVDGKQSFTQVKKLMLMK